MDKYNWKDLDFPAGIKDWKKFEKNNDSIALNILQVPHNEKIYTMYANLNTIMRERIK